ncbi:MULTISPECIES: hypothetical protein [unclassified Pseudomonas]|uniref:hypothetical protein n=1 Tax=Pseudomonas sp. URMO17WK12:I2 TaxID=1261623 RepID=UPI000DAE0093|nr:MULTISPECIES: hypothetical protein [unclassified Pseudomonas]PZW47288.1 hypothetical protein F469_01156 [Pseudomonas sp. URMO17WK12:I2]
MTRTRPFLVQFAVAMIAYVAAVIISSVLLASVPQGSLRTLCALIPIVPMIVVAVTVIRQVRELDELARAVHLEALAIAFVGTALITFSYGFLETAGFPRLSMFFVWPVLGTLWGLGAWISWRRYR